MFLYKKKEENVYNEQNLTSILKTKNKSDTFERMKEIRDDNFPVLFFHTT